MHSVLQGKRFHLLIWTIYYNRFGQPIWSVCTKIGGEDSKELWAAGVFLAAWEWAARNQYWIYCAADVGKIRLKERSGGKLGFDVILMLDLLFHHGCWAVGICSPIANKVELGSCLGGAPMQENASISVASGMDRVLCGETATWLILFTIKFHIVLNMVCFGSVVWFDSRGQQNPKIVPCYDYKAVVLYIWGKWDPLPSHVGNSFVLNLSIFKQCLILTLSN